MIYTHIFKNRYFLLSILLIASMLTACSSGDDGGVVTSPVEASWKGESTVSADKGNATMLLSGATGTPWKAEILEGSEWCAFDYNFSGDAALKEGKLNEGLNVIYVYFRPNTATTQRVAKIHLTLGSKETQVLQLTQNGVGQVVKPPFGRWVETPAVVQNANYEYVTHYTKLNGQKVRNYSICLDKTKKTSLWVAYPLHPCYRGGVKRTDAWDFDPYVADNFQPNIYRGFRSKDESRYDRGHQLPSADRLATQEMNEQTFYFTNMTPQLSRLNQDMWAKFEGKVRDNMCSDTLYVVTGAYFAHTNKKAIDNKGKEIPVPTHYFKVLLRTKHGNTGKKISECQPSELIAIGAWVEQKNYGDINPPRDIFMSVSAIEKKTGITFFPQIAESVKQQYNYSDWKL